MKLAILDANFSFPKNNTYHCCSFSNPFCKFIRMMLRLNIEDRITIDDCIEKTQLLIDHCPKHEVYWGVCLKGVNTEAGGNESTYRSSRE